MKICSSCGEDKEITEYYSDVRRKQCKKCLRENALKNHNKKKEIVLNITSKICTTCGIEKEIKQFPKWRNVCKVCHNIDRNEYNKNYFKNNPEKLDLIKKKGKHIQKNLLLI